MREGAEEEPAGQRRVRAGHVRRPGGLHRAGCWCWNSFDEEAAETAQPRLLPVHHTGPLLPGDDGAAGQLQTRPSAKAARCGRSSKSSSGTTLEEARGLNRSVLSIFDETQVFRIDHYLGKETIQNMMTEFHFANGHVRAGLEPQLHRQRADHRSQDLRHRPSRADYYGPLRPGARDLIQARMLQAACATWRWSAGVELRLPKTCATRRSRCCSRSAAHRRGHTQDAAPARSTAPAHARRR